MANKSRSSSTILQLLYLRDLLRELVVRDLKLKYKRSWLGIGWSLLNPLLQLLVFYFVFTTILPVSTPDFALFLFTGLLAWNWFQSSVHAGCGAITDNAALIRQPGFPSAVLPVVTVFSGLIHYLLALPIAIIAVVLAGHGLTLALLALPFVVAVQFLLTLSIVYFLATLHVPFRDTQYIVGVVLLLGFYVSPVFYSTASIPAAYRIYYAVNPLTHILSAYRTVLVSGSYPDYPALFIVAGISIFVLTASYAFFVRASHWFVEEIGG